MDDPPIHPDHYLVWCTIKPHWRAVPYSPGSSTRVWAGTEEEPRLPAGAIAWRPLPAPPKVKYELDLGDGVTNEKTGD